MTCIHLFRIDLRCALRLGFRAVGALDRASQFAHARPPSEPDTIPVSLRDQISTAALPMRLGDIADAEADSAPPVGLYVPVVAGGFAGGCVSEVALIGSRSR